jgi:hypothetical protein
MHSTTRRLAMEHIATDAPVGVSATNGKATTAPTSDLPGYFDFHGASMDAYRSMCYFDHLLAKMSQTPQRLRRGCRPAFAAIPLSICGNHESISIRCLLPALQTAAGHLSFGGDCTTTYGVTQASRPHIWRSTNVLCQAGQSHC